LNGVIKQVVEFDIPQFADFNVVSIQKLKKLLFVLAQSVPFNLDSRQRITRNVIAAA